MNKFILASAGLILLAACGGGAGDRQAIVSACVEDGGMSQEGCECLADTAKENLSADLYGKMADAARASDAEADEMLNDLGPEEQGEFMAFAMQAAVTCQAS